MSVLGDLYLLRLRRADSEAEFEEEILSILSRIDYRLKKGELTIKAANDLIDEIVKGLLESGFEKRSQFGLEEYGGLEDLHESLSLDNSKSDELLAMAYPRTKSHTKKDEAIIMDANIVIAIFTTIMAIAACVSAFYAFCANRKSDEANANSSAANTLAGEANDNSSKANTLADQALKNSQGDSELLVYNSLSDALRRQDDAVIRYIEARERHNNDEEHFAVEAYKTFSDSAVQGYLNAFDIACQRYLDGKLDKIRFKKTYFTRIKELFDHNNMYFVFIRDRATTKYHALHAVNAEFHDLESKVA